VDEWLHKNEIWVDRIVNETVQEVDIRPYVANINFENNKLIITTQSANGRVARINEILDSFFEFCGMEWHQFLIQRTDQFEEREQKILSPFEEV
jgi:hypothetical protein